MKLEDFDFDLPKELIAQKPANPRNHARLLIYNRGTKEIIDDYFYNLDKYLCSNTTLVLNNSKVEKCRLRFGNVELFILETVNPMTVKAMVRPGKKFRQGQTRRLGPLEITVIDIDNSGIRTLELNMPVDDKELELYRLTPLPPYIIQDENLSADYQTVYAKPLGSRAAPTAGLHFTGPQLELLKASHPMAELTLHVGLGTFAPIKNTEARSLHSENFQLDTANARILNGAKHITAVGTTSARTLESLIRPFRAKSAETDIFIKPGYKFINVDSLITNFHLPKTSLLMLVAAFMGSTEESQRVYAHAIQDGYRFYSFGDAMLIR